MKIKILLLFFVIGALTAPVNIYALYTGTGFTLMVTKLNASFLEDEIPEELGHRKPPRALTIIIEKGNGIISSEIDIAEIELFEIYDEYEAILGTFTDDVDFANFFLTLNKPAYIKIFTSESIYIGYFEP